MKLVSECCGAPTKIVKKILTCNYCNQPCTTVEDFTDEAEENERQMEEDVDEDSFEPCGDCDLPDACADFGCAIQQGIKKPDF